MNRYTVHERDDGLFVVWDTELCTSVVQADRDESIRIANALNHAPDILSCGALYDHSSHPNEGFTCPGHGPFLLMERS